MLDDDVTQVRLPDGTVVWARVAGADRLPVTSSGVVHNDVGGSAPAADGFSDTALTHRPTPPPGAGFADTGFADRAAAAVEGMSDLIRGVAGSLRSATRAFAPDEVTVEFGIDLTAKPGKVVGLLADAEATAAIKVTLTWQKDSSGASAGTTLGGTAGANGASGDDGDSGSPSDGDDAGAPVAAGQGSQ